MSSLDFPDNPQPDDIFQDRWKWDGSKWIGVDGGAGRGGIVIDPTAPSDPSEGDVWFDSANNQLNAWDGTDWVPISPNLSAAMTYSTFWFPTASVAGNFANVVIVSQSSIGPDEIALLRASAITPAILTPGASGSAVFQINKLSSAHPSAAWTTTAVANITFANNSRVGVPNLISAVDLAPGDMLQALCVTATAPGPAPQAGSVISDVSINVPMMR